MEKKLLFYITPDVAEYLHNEYYVLHSDPNTPLQIVRQFDASLLEIAKFNKWEYKTVQEIVDHLFYLAQKDNNLPQAQVPTNLEDLVKTYVEDNKTLRSAPNENTKQKREELRLQLLKQAQTLERLNVTTTSGAQKQEVYNSKPVENTVREIPQTRYIPPIASPKQKETPDNAEPREPKRDLVNEWVVKLRQAEQIQQISKALEKTDLPKELIEPVAQELATLGAESVVNKNPIDEIRFAQTVADAIKNNDQTNLATLIPHSDEIINQLVKDSQTALPEINAFLGEIADKQTDSTYFKLDEKLPRPQTRILPTSPPQEETLNEPEKKNRTEFPSNTLLVMYHQTPQWEKVFNELNPMAIFFGNRKDSRDYILGALNRIQIEDPTFYSQNQLAIELIRKNIKDILPDNIQISKEDQVRIVTQAIAQGGTVDVRDVVGVKLVELHTDTETGVIGITNIEGKYLPQTISSLAQGNTPSQDLGVTTNYLYDTIRSIKKDAENTAKNIASYSQIKASSWLRLPNLQWLRISFSSTPGSSTAASFFRGGGFGPNLSLPSLGRTISNTFNLASLGRNTLAIGSRLVGALSVGATSEVLIPIGAIIAAVIIILITVGYFQDSQTHGIFLTQKTSNITVSKYISINKTSPQQTFDNDKVPDKIPFTITVSAKKEKLTNVTITDQASALGKSIANQNWSVPEISNSWVQDYTISIPPDIKTQLKDTIITNNVSVRANVDGVKDPQTENFTYVIVIGSPNSGCVVFNGTWPSDYKSKAQIAFSMLSRFPSYMSNICKSSSFGQNIIVQYGGSKSYGGEVNGGNIMTLYDRAFDSRGYSCTFYTIAHESGHVLANKNPDILADFLINVDPGNVPPHKEYFITSYTLGYEPKEDFAESIAVYIKRQLGEYGCTGNYDNQHMETISPIHYNFWGKYIK